MTGALAFDIDALVDRRYQEALEKAKGRLNVQGLARRDPLLMSTFKPDPGKTTISIDLCYPPETEFLTREGWRTLDDIPENAEIWQVNPETLEGSWVRPLRRIDQTRDTEWVTYSTVRGSLRVTRGHKMLWVGQINHPTRKDKQKYRKVTYAGDALHSGLHFALFTERTYPVAETVTDRDIWIACMLHADGWFNPKEGRYVVQVSRARKREKVRELLGRPGRVRAVREGQNLPVETFSYVENTSPLLWEKSFINLHLLSQRQVDVFVEALAFWDGSRSVHSSRTGRITWGSCKKGEAEKVQTFLSTSGYGARMRECPPVSGGPSGFYVLSIRKKDVLRVDTGAAVRPSGSTKGTEISTSKSVSRSVCFEVPEGFLFVRQNGQTFVSGNCSGEPTVTSHFSRDKNYLYACFDGVGKAPFWSSGVLMIDDIYLMVASVSTIFKREIQAAWERRWPAGSFADQWMADAEVVKGFLKTIRQRAKILALGLGYGMGPKKMVKQAYDFGFNLSQSDARAFYKAYWELFSGVRKLSDRLAAQLRRDGYLINPFGYRLTPSDFKAFNYFIQSSVSGIMHVFTAKLMAAAPYAEWVTLIHDELLLDVDTDRVEEFRGAVDLATRSLNDDLGWSVAIRTGFVTGSNWYEAK